jgi:hypothetical protein
MLRVGCTVALHNYGIVVVGSSLGPPTLRPINHFVPVLGNIPIKGSRGEGGRREV